MAARPRSGHVPKRNRVTPMGDIVAAELRGAWLGNRGILHEGQQIVRFHRSQLWIVCALQFRDQRLNQWQPGHFTVLYFHDEAVALAAGHRPCALCRRESYNAYRAAWADGNEGPVPSAAAIDRQLHGERLVRGTHRRRLHEMPWPELPQGAFVLLDEAPALVLDDAVVPWTATGYAPARRRPRRGSATAITPPSTIGALRAGYRPNIDPGALAFAPAVNLDLGRGWVAPTGVPVLGVAALVSGRGGAAVRLADESPSWGRLSCSPWAAPRRAGGKLGCAVERHSYQGRHRSLRCLA